MLKELASPGSYFAKAGVFYYWDTLDAGGKSFQAKSYSGFIAGPLGLYLKPSATGEIIYDMRAAEGLSFKTARLPVPGGPHGWDVTIRLGLPEDGHNKIQISLDQGQTWITAYEAIEPSRRSGFAYDLTDYVAGSNQFLIKNWVQNSKEEILGMDSWVIAGTIE